VRVRTKGLYTGPVIVKPEGGGRLMLSQRPPGASRVISKWYRGSLEVRPANGGLLAINLVGIEDYLYGVLPAEATPDWPVEALKAQAVASRTFALSRRLKRGSGFYDLDSSIASQVYVGAGREDGRTNAAVDETRGLVITYEDAPIPAYYHANSGGHTEDVKDVWGGSSQPYLRSIDDPFGKDGSRYEWSARLSLDEIRRMLASSGIDLPGQIYRIDAAGVSPSNRVTQLLITYQGGAVALSGNTFRLALDPLYTIKSTMFTVRQVDGTMEFVGYGSGHGVGLSQESAKAMAEKGFDFQLILGYFYPGTEISKVEIISGTDSVSMPTSK
jgi:stage II sporulation protein D